MATLKEAKIGSTVTVKKLNGTGAVKRRIMDMGITKGVEVHVRKVAPLGDPIEVTVRGYELSLRKADAEMIETVWYIVQANSKNFIGRADVYLEDEDISECWNSERIKLYGDQNCSRR